MKKYKLTYESAEKILRFKFIEYVANEDVEALGADIVRTIGQDREVPFILGDLRALAGKKLKLMGRKSRQLIAGLGDRYGVKRIAMLGVPVVIRTLVRGIITLMRNKAVTVYQFFSTEEQALAWLKE